VKSLIASLRSLVLPWGRTSGPRIVLDGVNGEILLYNATNDLVYRIAGSIPGAAAGPASGSQVVTEYTGTSGRIRFPMHSPAENLAALLQAAVSGSGTVNEQLSFTMFGPTTDTNTDRCDVILTSENEAGTLPARFRVVVKIWTQVNNNK